MSGAHTPGPWRRGREFGSIVADTGRDNPRIVEVYGGHVVAETVTDANAPLIIAAPDLLEALTAVMRVIDGRDDRGPDTLPTPVWQQARAALAKARGEQ